MHDFLMFFKVGIYMQTIIWNWMSIMEKISNFFDVMTLNFHVC